MIMPCPTAVKGFGGVSSVWFWLLPIPLYYCVDTIIALVIILYSTSPPLSPSPYQRRGGRIFKEGRRPSFYYISPFPLKRGRGIKGDGVTLFLKRYKAGPQKNRRFFWVLKGGWG
jgi:hypothetical protein